MKKTAKMNISGSVSESESRRVSKAHAELLRELRGVVPEALWEALAEKFRRWHAAVSADQERAQKGQELLQTLQANCTAEEQIRVALIERVVSNKRKKKKKNKKS